MPNAAPAHSVADTVVAPRAPDASAAGRSRPRDLHDGGVRVAQTLEVGIAEPDVDGAGTHGNPGRHCALSADACVEVARGFEVARRRESLSEDARFERDQASTGGTRGPDFLREAHYIAVHADWTSGQRAALAAARAPAAHARCRASSGEAPATSAARKVPSNASPAPVASSSSTAGDAW